MLKTIAIKNFRSARSLVLPVGNRITVVHGTNAVGKSNVLGALAFVASIARDDLAAAVAEEGGWESILWAGPELQTNAAGGELQRAQGTVRRAPLSVAIGLRTEELSYSIDVGLSPIDSSAFAFTPEIKRECAWRDAKLRPSTLLADRRGPVLQTRDVAGHSRIHASMFIGTESMFSKVGSELKSLSELNGLREHILDWRFYKDLRTDREAPGRQPAVNTCAFSLDEDGSNLSSVLYAIHQVGFNAELSAAVAKAFPDAKLVFSDGGGHLSASIRYRRLLRTVAPHDFSQGTMRYLLLVAALLAPKPGTMLCFDEPEASLHPSVMDPLVRLFDFAAQRSHVWVVTHSPELLTRLERLRGCRTIKLSKAAGETLAEGIGMADQPQWTWPSR